MSYPRPLIAIAKPFSMNSRCRLCHAKCATLKTLHLGTEYDEKSSHAEAITMCEPCRERLTAVLDQDLGRVAT